MAEEGDKELAIPKLWQSRMLSAAIAVVIVLTALGATSGAATKPSDTSPNLCAAVRQWRAEHAESDLQVVVSDLTFRDTPGDFALGEGLIVLPIAVVMPGVQEVLAVHADPPATRVLAIEGVKVVTWPYAASLHREMHFRAAALVRRAPAKVIEAPPATFESLPPELRIDAMVPAKDSDDHELDTCKNLHEWAVTAAGEPPYTEQLRRIAVAVRPRRVVETKRAHDICAALREKAFSPHQAHVIAVQALRELGVPSYGLLGADGQYLVAIFSDPTGWITLDLDDIDHGFTTGGPPLISLAPMIARSPSSSDGHWLGDGLAIESNGSNGVRPKSFTRWEPRARPPATPALKDDNTVTWTGRLGEMCP